MLVRRRTVQGLLAAAALLAACSPSMDWRDWRPDDSGLKAQFPCRPASHARDVMLGSQRVTMTMHACGAAESTFAVAWFDVADAASMEPALEALKAAALHNTDATGQPVQDVPYAVRGATQQRRAGRWQWSGRLPDGQPIVEQLAAFTRGTRVVQATVVARAVGLTPSQRQSVDTFFEALQWPQ